MSAAVVLMNSQPLPRHPGHSLGCRRIEIREHNHIVPAGKISFYDRVHSTRAARDSYSGREAARNTMLAQRLHESEKILRG
jgi:hypothetical protein